MSCFSLWACLVKISYKLADNWKAGWKASWFVSWKSSFIKINVFDKIGCWSGW